jgi:hypothetical protein
MTFRIAVTGSRSIDERGRRIVERTLNSLTLAEEPNSVTLLHGGADGVDYVASNMAKNIGWEVIEFPADWSTHGKAAGPIRNRQMLDSSVDILLAFPAPDSIGTWDCIRAAVERKIRVRIYPL